MENKRGQIRPSADTMEEFNKLISKIHVENGKKLTHEQYIKEANELMEIKYKQIKQNEDK